MLTHLFELFDHDSKRENQRIEAFPFYAEPKLPFYYLNDETTMRKRFVHRRMIIVGVPSGK